MCGLGGPEDQSKGGSSVLSCPLLGMIGHLSVHQNGQMQDFLLRSDLIHLGTIMHKDLASGYMV